MSDYFPPIDERLVAALAEKFPSQSPALDTPERQVWFDAGCAHVVEWLALKMAEQNEMNLEGL